MEIELTRAEVGEKIVELWEEFTEYLRIWDPEWHDNRPAPEATFENFLRFLNRPSDL